MIHGAKYDVFSADLRSLRKPQINDTTEHPRLSMIYAASGRKVRGGV
jgi:hypothetical protein